MSTASSDGYNASLGGKIVEGEGVSSSKASEQANGSTEGNSNDCSDFDLAYDGAESLQVHSQHTVTTFRPHPNMLCSLSVTICTRDPMAGVSKCPAYCGKDEGCR
jgi:hypothetical protein